MELRRGGARRAGVVAAGGSAGIEACAVLTLHFRRWQRGTRAIASAGNAMKAEDVNLYLVGFMGTGKTTVGRAVGHRVGFKCVDSDHEIERKQGKGIPAIFAEQGEPAFRVMEREFIEGGHPETRTVVACGGGLVVQPGMLAALQTRGVVVCLHASVETILARTSRNNTRPLLAVDDPEARIRKLFAEREPIYRAAGSVILTDGRPLGDIVLHVLRVWRRDAADFVRRGNGGAVRA